MTDWGTLACLGGRGIRCQCLWCMLALMGSLSSACRGRVWQEAGTDRGALTLVGVPPIAHRVRGWCVGREAMMETLSLVLHSTMALHFQGNLCFLKEESWLWSSSLPSPQAVLAQLIDTLPSLQATSMQPTAVFSQGLLS